MRFMELLRSLVVRALVLGLIAGLIIGVLAGAVSAFGDTVLSSKSDIVHRDLVMIGTNPRGCRPVSSDLSCVTALYFNGNWSGVQLCKRDRCYTAEELFDFERRAAK